MSDALPLPPRPNLEQYKKLSKDLQRACRSSEPGAIRDWAAHWVEAIARLQAQEITPERRRQISHEARRIEERWRKLKSANGRSLRCTLVDAQFFVARAHGFASWPKFAKHVESMARASSPVLKFESAVDAIVGGDGAALERLLLENPELARARSTREHHSTLLHYVSANGVEDFRQRTPKNIVEIAKLLLAAGVDVNAESEAYGGRSTTLALTATSWHPEAAGLQLPLMELLLDHGAIIDGPGGGGAVNGCLHNGRGAAAEFLASRGAKLDLEGAAGVGRLDLVKTYFSPDGSLKPPATEKQKRDGFAWACEFGKTNVVDFLLQRGIPLDARLRHDGQTGLHWAALGGHSDTVKLLLERKAPVEIKDQTYGGTPLGWALYAWGTRPDGMRHESYYAVVAQLVSAGAVLDPWLEDDENRRVVAQKMRGDPRMLAALRGVA